jgi:hypothetical protein
MISTFVFNVRFTLKWNKTKKGEFVMKMKFFIGK